MNRLLAALLTLCIFIALVYAKGAVDSDGDGFIDAIDECPHDSTKTRPGKCGCNHAETDSDGDSVPDCKDACPTNPFKRSAGRCGCEALEGSCGCNVEPMRLTSCEQVVATEEVLPPRFYSVYGQDGEEMARVYMPAGGKALADGERLTFRLRSAADVRKAAAHTDGFSTGAVSSSRSRHARHADAVHSSQLELGIFADSGRAIDARERTANGYVVQRAIRVCLRPDTTQHKGLCLGFLDAHTNEYKCFENELVYEDGLACARTTYLTKLQLVRQSRQSSMAPFIRSALPRECPADGRCELVLSGDNLDRGVLTALEVGGRALDVRVCKQTRHQVVCSRVPAGRGTQLPITLEFTNHKDGDFVTHARLDAALSYERPQIYEVRGGDSLSHVVVHGANFGPSGALDSHQMLVDGAECAEAHVDGDSGEIVCRLDADAKTSGAASRSVSLDLSGAAVSRDADTTVTSTEAHWYGGCDTSTHFECQDRSCVERADFCPRSPSGWSRCPLSKPVLDPTSGSCHPLRFAWQQRLSHYDVTYDGSDAAAFPLGEHAHMLVRRDTHGVASGGGAHRTSLGIGTPAAEDGFEAGVFNITSVEERFSVEISVRSDSVTDTYGYCLGRYNVRTHAWECVDENLEFGPAPHHAILAHAHLDVGSNILALIPDNCPDVHNPEQADEDGDGVGDACAASAEAGAADCRDRSAANSAYIRRTLMSAKYRVGDSDVCGSDAAPGVCAASSPIYALHASNAEARPLPKGGVVEGGAAKGARRDWSKYGGANFGVNEN